MTEVLDEREAAVAAFAEVATPEEKAKVGVVEDSVGSVVAAAQSLEVRTADEASHATEVLARIAGEKTRAEKARRFLVDPLNAHVKAINDRFRGPRDLLERADKIIREKVLAYNAELERRRAEEQARLDAERAERERQAEEERRAAEARARAEREAAARAAAQAEAAAKAAERKREEELEAAASERRREIAQMEDAALEELIAQGTGHGLGSEEAQADGVMAASELGQRHRAREAQEHAARAAQREEEARAREEEERNRPLPDVPETVVAPSGPLRSGKSTASQRKVWKATAIDVARLPAKYLIADEKAINEAIRQGAREIAGVTIEQVAELSVRAR